jgi:hypothetical protein
MNFASFIRSTRRPSATMRSGSARWVEFLGVLVTIIAITITAYFILISDMLNSLAFMSQQISSINFGADIISLSFGIAGFFYIFFLPGLPLLRNMNTNDLYDVAKYMTIATTYSGIGCYVSMYILMALGASIIFPIVPGILILPALLFSQRIKGSLVLETPVVKVASDSSQHNRWIIIVLLALVTIVALFIRQVVFSSFVVEYSDGLEYHQMIDDILRNDYLFNEADVNWAPLYPLFGSLLSLFTSSPLVALKSLSFCFSFLLIAPSILLVDSFVKEPGMKSRATLLTVFLLLTYPWFNIMAGVNLQDIIAVYFTAASVALLFSSKVPIEFSASAAGLAFLTRYTLGVIGPISFLFLLGFGRSRLRDAFRYAIIWSILIGSWVVRNFLVGGVLLSSGDEGRFSLEYLQGGIISLAGRIALDIQTMNPGVLWLPLGFLVIVIFLTASKRGLLRATLLSREMILIWAIIIIQGIILSLFESHQERFMLTIFYFLPIIWCSLATKWELKFSNALVFGWALWGTCFSIVLNYTYWYVANGRLPVGDVTYSYHIVEATFPSISSIAFTTVALTVSLLAILSMELLGQRSKS